MSSNDICRDGDDENVPVVVSPIDPPLPPEMPNLSPTKLEPAETTNLSAYVTDEHMWAVAHPEVQKACFLARVCPFIPPKSCRLKNIPSIMQEGPTCGMTAVSMLGLGVPRPDQLLQSARTLGFTQYGEMFSARNLLELIRSRDGSDNGVSKNTDDDVFHLHDGRLDCEQIRDALVNGGCLLVPYDADFNNGPCLRKGHKAHWALIIGYLLDDEDQFFVFARHGKTKNLAVWSLAELSESNANLIEFEPPKGHPHLVFKLPEGGVGGALGLKDKCIIIDSVSEDITDIVVR